MNDQYLEHVTPDIESDAYNEVGERLRTDEQQKKMTLAASVLAGVGSVVLILAVIL